MKEIDLSISVAMTEERVIGSNNKLPWRLPSDMERFRRNTIKAGVIVMGHNTYASILDQNGNPLPGRKHIVLTRNKFLSSTYELVKFVKSLQEVRAEIAASGWNACIIGGGEIYKMFLPLPEVRTILLTIVHAPELKGDVYFPELAPEWECVHRSAVRLWNPNDEYETSFEVRERP